MTFIKEDFKVLMADDDPDDRMLAREAFEESQLADSLVFVEDGEELMDYLHQRGKYHQLGANDLPKLILLDLNMPKKDGKEALKEIKGNPKFRRIPVVIITTSKEEMDIFKTYDLGANSYIVKPVAFNSMVDLVASLQKYWFEIVNLPK